VRRDLRDDDNNPAFHRHVPGFHRKYRSVNGETRFPLASVQVSMVMPEARHFSDLTRPLQMVSAHGQLIPAPRVAKSQQAREQKASPTSPLDRYLEGWAELNLDEIVDATAAGYCFRDPLVGTYSRWSLLEYFDALMHGCSRAGSVKQRDLAFELHGPMEGSSHLGGIWFWREAPRIGLIGVTQIKVGAQGVIGESVAYEGNLASEMLRRAAQCN